MVRQIAGGHIFTRYESVRSLTCTHCRKVQIARQSATQNSKTMTDCPKAELGTEVATYRRLQAQDGLYR